MFLHVLILPENCFPALSGNAEQPCSGNGNRWKHRSQWQRQQRQVPRCPNDGARSLIRWNLKSATKGNRPFLANFQDPLDLENLPKRASFFALRTKKFAIQRNSRCLPWDVTDPGPESACPKPMHCPSPEGLPWWKTGHRRRLGVHSMMAPGRCFDETWSRLPRATVLFWPIFKIHWILKIGLKEHHSLPWEQRNLPSNGTPDASLEMSLIQVQSRRVPSPCELSRSRRPALVEDWPPKTLGDALYDGARSMLRWNLKSATKGNRPFLANFQDPLDLEIGLKEHHFLPWEQRNLPSNGTQEDSLEMSLVQVQSRLVPNPCMWAVPIPKACLGGRLATEDAWGDARYDGASSPVQHEVRFV